MINYLRRFCAPLLRTTLAFNKNIYYVGTEGPKKLELYQKIKQKQMGNIAQNQLNQQSIERYYTQHRCDGCNSILQCEDKEKYGYIKQQTLQKGVKENIQVIENTYGEKVKRVESRVLQVISHVERELGIKIFNNQTKSLDHLNNVEVLLRLQEKLDQYEDQQQTIKRIKKQRAELFCARCYSLKYYNKLPQQFDTLNDIHLNNSEVLLSKVLKKHKNVPTFFMYVIDVLDIAGSFKKFVFDKLIAQNIEFCVVINKIDIINPKYLNKHLILDVVRKRMEEIVSDRTGSEKTAILEKIKNIKVVMVTSTRKQGIKALEEHIENNLIKRIQIIGFPNTGKTTLLNQLARINKPTSKVPGTTIFITEHFYKKKVIYDMPGMHCEENLSNKITRPNLKGLLTWNKFYSPPLFINNAFFFGGKVEIKGVKIILFGHGGACDSDNRWFLLNFRVFWKGLPPLQELKIKKYTIDLVFEEGKSKDLQIAGWGFMSFRTAYKDDRRHNRQLTLYLPEGIEFRLRQSILKDNQVFEYKSIVKKRHRIERVHEEKRKQRVTKAKTSIE